MKSTDYPGDLTDAQFARLEPHLPKARPGGRPRQVNLHDVVTAILYVDRTGCRWRAPPKEYGPWSTAYDDSRKWRTDGTWQKVNDQLREQVRRKAGRQKAPEVAALGSQSAEAGGSGGGAGHGAGKKVTGRKRPLLVGSLGLLLAALVTAASVTDARAAAEVLAALPLGQLPRLAVIRADSAYGPAALAEGAAGWSRSKLGVVRRPGGGGGVGAGAGAVGGGADVRPAAAVAAAGAGLRAAAGDGRGADLRGRDLGPAPPAGARAPETCAQIPLRRRT
jgi:putative transposase